MSVQETTNRAASAAEQSPSLTARDLLWMCLSRWYWFVISLAVCLGAGVYYIMRTPPVYERRAQLLIRDDRLGGTPGGDVGASFAGMGFLQANTNVLNELATLTSPTLMAEVVSRLGLDVECVSPGVMHDRVLYGGTLPARFSFPGMGADGSGSLEASLRPDGTLGLSGFAGPDGPVGDEGAAVEGRWDRPDTLLTPLGAVAVAPNPLWAAPEGWEGAGVRVRRTPPAAVARARSASLAAEAPEDYASVIALSVTDVSPRRAEDVLSALIDVYNENWVRDKNRIAVSTSSFIKERLAVIEDELGNVDSDISAYKSANMVPDVEQASALYFSRAASASDEVAALDGRLATARYIRSYLANSANSLNVLPATAGLDNLNIEAQIADYNGQLLRRNNLAENSSSANPLVADMDSRLDGMRRAILQSIDNYVVTLNAQAGAARSSQEAASSRLRANPSQARHLLSVERQQKVKESLYLYLLQKREENELSQAFTAYNTRVITPPTGADAPVAPSRRNVMLAAAMAGLLLPLGGVYLAEGLNTRVRGRKDLEGLTVPFLGEIPLGYTPRRGLARLRRARDDERDRRVVMVRKGSGNAVNEAFRVMRTNLELMADADAAGGRVTAVTSANPGSGKTFVAMNLATAMAIKGQRVAVVDLDLRKGSLSAFAGSPASGVSALLSGHAALDAVLRRDACSTPGLDIVPAGALPPNPAELLYSPRLKAMLDSLRATHDAVLLDCPPVEVVADAKVINRHADMTLFVVRAGLLEREMLPHIQAFYDSGRYHNMALVLNGTDPSHLGPLRSRYGYGYGYGYGYNRKDRKK